MADQRININIGSTYNGTGLEKAMGGLGKMSNAAGKGARAIGQIGGAFDSLGGQASKAIGSVTSALGAIASGGLVGGAVAAIASLTQMFIDMANKAEAAKKAQEQVFSDNMNKAIDSYGKNLDKVIGKLEKLQTQQEKVAQSTNALNAALSDKSIAERQLEAAKDVANASAEDRGVVQAQANADVARMKGDRSVAAADENVKMRQGKLDTTNQVLAKLNKELAGMASYANTLKEMNAAYHDSAKKSGFTDMETVDKAHRTQIAYDKATKKLTEMQEKQAALMAQREAQEKDLQAAKMSAETARMNADAENIKANQSVKEAEEKQFDEEEKARKAEADAIWEGSKQRLERNQTMKDEERAE